MRPAAWSAQRRMSPARTGSDETLGISTISFSAFSNASRSRLANATNVLLSIDFLPLEPDGLPPSPMVGGAEAVARLRIDHDSLRVAEVLGFFAKVIPHRLECRPQRRGSAAGLPEHLVRQPLMMKARRIDGL